MRFVLHSSRNQIYLADRRELAHDPSNGSSRIRLGRNIMSLVHHPDRSHDLSLVGLVLVVFGIIAATVPCLKMAVDKLFLLF
jgi:hypothetical protein